MAACGRLASRSTEEGVVTLPALLHGQRWYVAFTQSNCEMRAAKHLQNQGFPAYVPRFLKRRRQARRIDTFAAPLFPRYVFVGLDVERQRWRSVNGTVGVSHLICHGDRPTPLDEAIVHSVAMREGEDGLVRLALTYSFQPGQAVRVTDGLFADQLGLYEGMADRERVRILLNLLGRKVRVVIEPGVLAVA
jgi:transcriptional antiterminator RfaH